MTQTRQRLQPHRRYASHVALLLCGATASVAIAGVPASAPDERASKDQAEALLDDGRLADALNVLQAAARQNPADADAAERLAIVTDLSGNPEQAAAALRTAEALATDPARRMTLGLRRAVVLFDSGHTDDANAALSAVVKTAPAAAVPAGVIASFFGQDCTAADDLQAAPPADTALQMLAGNAALAARRFDEAGAIFAAAAKAETTPAMRRYAVERVIATARAAGRLGGLADAWVRRPDLPPEDALPLATILRELDRGPELLRWWQAAAARDAGTPALLSRPLINEVLGAARESGRLADAEAICTTMLSRDAQGDHWLEPTLRVLLDQRKDADADALLERRIDAAAQTPGALRRLGRLALSLGRPQSAFRAADKLEALAPDDVIGGKLLRASALLASDDASAAATTLHSAAAAAHDDPDLTDAVATALEAAGLTGDAIDLLQASAAARPSDELLGHLATLQLSQHRGPDAIKTLQRLRHTGGSVAVRAQAAQQLIDAAQAEHALDAVIAAAQADIDAGHARPEDLMLLVDAHVRAGHADAAVALVKSSKLLDAPSRSHELAVLALRCKDLPAAAEALRQLVTADPATAVDSLEQLASVQLSLHAGTTAMQTIKEIAGRLGNDAASEQLLGGVYDRLARPAEAAAHYRRALAGTPGDSDTWLLWAAAMAKAGQAPAAEGRLALLAQRASSTNLFTVAADGLLNLNASPAALRAVRREAVLRLATTPHQMLLYHVLGDLSDELHDTPAVLHALSAGLPMSDDERVQQLRELVDTAGQRGMVDVAVDASRSLLALGDNFPPQSFLQLGEELLVAGHHVDAARAFGRAADAGGRDVVAPKSAAVYERFGFVDDALALLEPLAAGHGGDAVFQEQLARLHEAVGDRSAAYDGFFAALQLAQRTMLASTAPDASAFGQSPEQAAFRRNALAAAAMARTPPQQERLVRSLCDGVDRLVRRRPGVNVPADVSYAATVLRQVAFALGRNADADAQNLMIIRTWPADRDFAAAAAASRAVEALPALPGTEGNAPPATGPATAPSTAPATFTPSVAAATLPPLLLSGRTEEAGGLLRATPVAASPQPANTFLVLVTAANVLDAPSLADQWALAWLDAAITVDRTPRPQRRPLRLSSAAMRSFLQIPGVEAKNAVTSSWALVSPAARRAMATRLAAAALDDKDPKQQSVMALLALQTAAEAGVLLPDPMRLAGYAMPRQDLASGSMATQVFATLTSDLRPQWLHDKVAAVPANARLSLLLQCLSLIDAPLDPPVRDAVLAELRALPPDQTGRVSDWFKNTAQRDILPAVADAVVAHAHDAGATDASAASALAAATVYAQAGDTDKADRTALAALATIRPATATVGPQLFDGGDARSPAHYLRLALGALSRATRQRLADDAAFAADDGTGWPAVKRAMLLDGLGKGVDALATLRAAYTQHPTDVPLLKAYKDRLLEDGRYAEVVEAFAASAGGTSGPNTGAADAVRVARRNLFDLLTVQAAITRVTPPPDLMTPVAAKNLDLCGQRMRIALQQSRGDRTPTLFEPTPAGLTGSHKRALDSDPDSPLLDGIDHWPGVVDDLVATLRLCPPADPNFGPQRAAWLCDVLARAAATPGEAKRLMDDMTARATAKTLLRSDRQAVYAIAASGTPVPRELIDALWNAAAVDLDGVELQQLARLLTSAADARAAAVSRWSSVWLGVGDGSQRRATPDATTPADTFAPGEYLQDVALSRTMSALLDAGHFDEAERLFARVRAQGRLPSDASSSTLAWAKSAALRHDPAAFRSRLSDWARGWAVAKDSDVDHVLPDITDALPLRCPDDDQRHALMQAAMAVLDDIAARSPADRDVVREMAFVGRWAAAQGDRPEAVNVLDRATAIALPHGVGEHLLWLADLAAAVGKPGQADAIERQLLDERCLPASRIAPLIARLHAADPTVDVVALAKVAAVYCREPSVLKLAGPRAN